MEGGVFLLPKNVVRSPVDELVMIDNAVISDRKKIKLRVLDSEGVPIEIVFKRSGRKGREHEFLFAVFRPVAGGYSFCIEQGYHTNIKRIKQYLFHKYIKQDESEVVENGT